MTAQFYTTTDRLEYIKAEGINYNVLKIDDEGFALIEIDIRWGTDVLDLFHAGIKYGMDAMTK